MLKLSSHWLADINEGNGILSGDITMGGGQVLVPLVKSNIKSKKDNFDIIATGSCYIRKEGHCKIRGRLIKKVNQNYYAIKQGQIPVQYKISTATSTWWKKNQ